MSATENPSILILDGNERSALACTRSLGRRGVRVHVAESTERSLAGESRYCHATVRYSSPQGNSEDCFNEIVEYMEMHDIRVLFPITDVSTHLVLSRRERLAGRCLPCSSFEMYESISDKGNLVDVAGNLGIPVPNSYHIDPLQNDPRLPPANLIYPAVLKPTRSRIASGSGYIETSVTVVTSPSDYVHKVDLHDWFRKYPFLAQEYIPGYGQGVSTYCKDGSPRALFAHRRLREKPPEGGVSVLSESIPITEDLRKYSIRLMSAFDWHGPAMIEYRIAQDGTPYLMEINARFWGSIALAIQAGVDFPYIAYRDALGRDIGEISDYRVGLRNRWLLGDLDNLYITLKSANSTVTLGDKIAAITKFLNFFPRRTFYEINQRRDLKPFWLELRRYFASL